MEVVIVDDVQLQSQGAFSNPSDCTVSYNIANAYQGTISLCLPGSTPSVPYIQVAFDGSTFRLVGRPTRGLVLNYSFDNSPILPAVLEYGNGDIGKDGVVLWGMNGFINLGLEHQLKFYLVSGQLDLDYITYSKINAHRIPSSPEVFVVDDQGQGYGGIPPQYTGPWSSVTGVSLPSGAPLNRTYSVSSTKGASFSTRFYGSRVAVQGLLVSAAGMLTASYSIDGGAPLKVVHFDGFQTVNTSQWALSQTLYEGTLPLDMHQLTVTVLEVTGDQRFCFDYLTFENPSYYTVTSNITSPGYGTYSTATAAASAVLSNGQMRGTNLGGIIGGSIAGVLILLALAVLFVKWRRQRSKGSGDAKTPLPTARPHSWNILAAPPPWSPPAVKEEKKKGDFPQDREDEYQQALPPYIER